MESRLEVKQKMFDLIGQWKTSGLSQKEFCLQHEIRYCVFHYWYKQYREANNARPQNVSSFIPLQLHPIATGSSFPTASHAELIYPDGRRLLFHQPVDASFLKTIIG
jgi:hypothetical protein